MLGPDTNWPEQEIIGKIGDALYLHAPDLYGPLVQGVLRNERFLAAKVIAPVAVEDGEISVCSLTDAEKVITELIFLIRQADFNRSIPQRKLFAGLTLATLLRRTQLCRTAEIKDYFLPGQKAVNISEYVAKIQNHLDDCLFLPRESGVRILILNSEKKGCGYPVRFYEPSAPHVLEKLLRIRAKSAKIGMFDRPSYYGRIVLALFSGRAVRVFTRFADGLLDDERFWAMLGQVAQRSSLCISLLDPTELRNDAEGVRIARNQARLRDRISQVVNPMVNVWITYHPEFSLDVEIACFGHVLLVGAAGGETFEEIRLGHPLFKVYSALLEDNCVLPSR